MLKILVGVCVGGPLDGQGLIARGTVYHVAEQTVMKAPARGKSTAESVRFGHYIWSPWSGGTWFWDGAF